MKEIYYEFDGNEFTYEAKQERVNEYVETCFENEYQITNEQAKAIIEDLDLYDTLEERYDESVKDFFEDVAYERYKDTRKYRSNPLAYYGMSQSDFI